MAILCTTDPVFEERSPIALSELVLQVIVSILGYLIYPGWLIHGRPNHTPREEFDQTNYGSTDIDPDTNTDGRIHCDCTRQDSDQTNCGSTGIESDTNTDGRIHCMIQDSDQTSCCSTYIDPETNTDIRIVNTMQDFDQANCGFTGIESDTNTDGRIHCMIQDSDQTSCGSMDIDPETNTDGRIVNTRQDSDQTNCGSTGIESETNADGRIHCMIQDSDQTSCCSTDIDPETNTDIRIVNTMQDNGQANCRSTGIESDTNTDGRIHFMIQDSDQTSREFTDIEETNADGRILYTIQDTGDVLKRDPTGTETADGSIYAFLGDSTQKLVGSKSAKCEEEYTQANLKTGEKMTGKSKNDAKNFAKRCDIARSIKVLDHTALKILISDRFKFELAGLLRQVSHIIFQEKCATLKIVRNLTNMNSYKARNSKNFSNGEAMISQREELMLTNSMLDIVYKYREDKRRDLSFRRRVKKGPNSTCLEKVSKSACMEKRRNSTCEGKRSSSFCMKNGFNSSSDHYVGFLACEEMWLNLILVGPRENKTPCEIISQIISVAYVPFACVGESRREYPDHYLRLSVPGEKVELYLVTSSGSKEFFVLLEGIKAKNCNSHYMIESMFWKENALAYFFQLYNEDKLPAIYYPPGHEGPVNDVTCETGDRKEKEMTSSVQTSELENKQVLLHSYDINDISGSHNEGETTHPSVEEENQGKYVFEACLYCIQDTIEYAVQSDVSLSKIRKTALMCAVSRKHTECLRAYLHGGADIDEADHKGRTALMLASMTEHCTSCLYFLIMNGASLDKADNEGFTALMHAARKGFLEYVVILVVAMTNGSSPESEIPKLPLINGSVTVTNMLRHIPVLGKDHQILNATDKQHKTALIHALENNFIHCVQAFVKAGADVNKADFRGKSPLMIVLKETSNLLDYQKIGIDQLKDLLVEEFVNHSQSHHLKVIRILLEAGADINQADHQGNTPLIQAVRVQDIQCCQLLLLHDADVNKRNNEKRTAFMYAARNVNTDLMKTLMAFGAEINLQDNNQQTGLMIIIHTGRSMSWFLYSGRNISIKAVKFLVKNGADLSARDKNGETALVTGVKNGQSLQCLQIISDKQSIDLPDNDGITALIHSLKLKTEEDVIHYASTLLEQGANPVIEPQFRYLLQPRTNFQQSEPRFHMEFFLEHKHFEMVRLLVSNGIVHSVADAFGVRYVVQPSLLNAALQAGHIEVAKYLIASNYLMKRDLESLRYLQVQCLSGQCTLINEGTRLVEQATSQPWPLGKLSFIAVSSAIGHGPRREARVRNTGLPLRLQEMLLFEAPVSRIPVNQWAKIKLRFDTVEHNRWPLFYYWPFDVDKNKINDVF